MIHIDTQCVAFIHCQRRLLFLVPHNLTVFLISSSAPQRYRTASFVLKYCAILRLFDLQLKAGKLWESEWVAAKHPVDFS